MRARRQVPKVDDIGVPALPGSQKKHVLSIDCEHPHISGRATRVQSLFYLDATDALKKALHEM